MFEFFVLVFLATLVSTIVVFLVFSVNLLRSFNDYIDLNLFLKPFIAFCSFWALTLWLSILWIPDFSIPYSAVFSYEAILASEAAIRWWVIGFILVYSGIVASIVKMNNERKEKQRYEEIYGKGSYRSTQQEFRPRIDQRLTMKGD